MTLECLARLAGRPATHVIVVDNGSADGTAEAVRDRFPTMQVVRLSHPSGFAAACNQGVRHGDSPFVLFLNSDVLALPVAVDRLAQELVRHPAAVAAGGRLVDPGTNETQERYAPKPFPRVRDFARILLGLRPQEAQLPPEDHVTQVDQPAGACLLVRRTDLEAIEGFDERFWFWYEDVDLCRRLSKRGPLLNVPAAAFEHLGGGTFNQWTRAMNVASLLHGMIRYAAEHFSRRQAVAFGGLLLFHSAPRTLAFGGELRRIHRKAVAAGLGLIRGKGAATLAGPYEIGPSGALRHHAVEHRPGDEVLDGPPTTR